MKVYKVVDADSGETVQEFDTGKSAGEYSSMLNEQYREEGRDRRVRVLAETKEPEETVPAVWSKYVAAPGPSRFPSRFKEDWDPSRNIDRYKVPAKGTEWRIREYYAGEDYPAVWTAERWYRESEYAALHYPRRSHEKPDMVAFTPSEEWGRDDRQKRISPGRYLSRFFGDVLSSEEIQEWALKHDQKYAPRDLKLAETAEEIERVYVDGPRSCMAGDCFATEVHPTTVYAAGDLALAYIENGDGEPSARCLVWPEEKIRSRIYGDRERLEEALDRAGYENGSLAGARIRKVRDSYRGTYILPYIDGARAVRDDGDYFVIDPAGGICAESTHGFAFAGHCASCGEGINRREDLIEHDGRLYCDYCADMYLLLCEECYEYTDRDWARETPDGEYYCTECYDEYVHHCDGCDAATWEEDSEPDPWGHGDLLCPTCYGDAQQVIQDKARDLDVPESTLVADTPAQAEQPDLL